MGTDQFHRTGLSDQNRQTLESWLEEFNRSWDEGRLAACVPGLPEDGSPLRLPALIEMVKIDLQRQWHRGRQVSLEAYLRRFPELGTPETVPTDLIRAEYEVRRQCGAPAELTEFAKRFSRRAEELLPSVDPAQGVASAWALDHLGQAIARPGPLSHSMARPSRGPGELPRQFGRYRIIKRLGRGGMGSVYLAHDTQLGRRVALKVPHLRTEGGTEILDDHAYLDRFYREARAAATFHHPNLCPVYDAGEIDGIHYLTMAYIAGKPLADFIDVAKPMPQRTVAAVVRKLALALEEAHKRGIVHRDLKPSNIMVTKRRRLIIMDFGLAWQVGQDDSRLTKAGSILGTPLYMSPEQLSREVGAIGPRCDIYSLGVIMYELLTAKRPFEGPEAVVLAQIIYVEPRPPSAHRPDLDPPIEAICLRAMAKKVDERYATMGDLAAALDGYLRGGNRQLPPQPAADSPGAAGTAEADVPSPAEGSRTAHAGAPGKDRRWSIFPKHSRPEGPSGIGPARNDPRRRGGESTESADLRTRWARWTAIVQRVALHLPRRQIDPEAYGTLHAELIKACRSLAATADPPKRAFYQDLEALAQPWLTPTAFGQADREILYDLLTRCLQALRDLDG